MRIYIADKRKTATVRIYGIDGGECTRKYFDTFFHNVIEIHETTDEEREICGKDPEYTIDTYDLFMAFAAAIGIIQDSIDEVALAVINEQKTEEYTFDGQCYAIGG